MAVSCVFHAKDGSNRREDNDRERNTIMQDGRETRLRVPGHLVFNSIGPMLEGDVIGMLPDFFAAPYLASGQLVPVLEDWSEPFGGLHLFYPSRRHASPAFSLFLDALRYRD